MTRKQQILAAIKTAAAQGDMKTATRLYIENRISQALFNETVDQGLRLAALVANREAKQAA